MNKSSDYNQAVLMALKVKFLSGSEEIFLYAASIYSAKKWGRGIDEKNKAREGDKPLK